MFSYFHKELSKKAADKQINNKYFNNNSFHILKCFIFFS